MHAATVLDLLTTQKCLACGRPAVDGAKICLSCVSTVGAADLAAILARSQAKSTGPPHRTNV
ncbi:MAG: hypothetical protein FJZ01_06010 [Candidatus Sericytochromatia bacterium]|nr:hypothetical protein [Candidatus Tanganyikabacteria bacterium]